MYGQAFGGEDTSSSQDLAENYVIGAEAQWYGEHHTLYMQAGYLDGTQVKNKAGYPTSGDRDVLDDAWFVRGVGRYFPDDNTRIQGEFTYVDGEQVSEANLDLMALSWEARFDRQVDDLWGYYVAYHGVHVAQTGPSSDSQCCEDLTDHTILAGIRLQLGSTTLLHQDRHGVTFSMPDVGRWGAYTTEAIDTGN